MSLPARPGLAITGARRRVARRFGRRGSSQVFNARGERSCDLCDVRPSGNALVAGGQGGTSQGHGEEHTHQCGHDQKGAHEPPVVIGTTLSRRRAMRDERHGSRAKTWRIPAFSFPVSARTSASSQCRTALLSPT